MLIVCEGSKTEILYFERERTKHRMNNLKIIPISSGDKHAKGIAQRAIREEKNHGLDLKNGDQIWCVFDVDNNNNDDLDDALAICGKKAKIALSNPCVELWYFLHFRDCDCKYSSQEMKERLKEYIPGYTESLEVYDKIIDKRDCAIKRAKKRVECISSDSCKLISRDSNPMTQFYLVLEAINSTEMKSMY